MQRLGVAVLTVFVLVLLLAGGVQTFGRPTRCVMGTTVGYHFRWGVYTIDFGKPGRDGFSVMKPTHWPDAGRADPSFFRCRLTHAELAAGVVGLVGVVYVFLLACDYFTKPERPPREPD